LDKARDLCPVFQTNTTWTANDLGNERVALFFRDPTHVQTICPGKTRQNQVLQGNQIVRLPTNCSLTGADLSISARSDLLLQLPLATYPEWNTSEFLAGKTPAEILELRARLQRQQVHPEDNVEWMVQQSVQGDLREDEAQWHDGHNYALYIASSLIVGILFFLFLRYVALWTAQWRLY
jgi:hypothetical protein